MCMMSSQCKVYGQSRAERSRAGNTSKRNTSMSVLNSVLNFPRWYESYQKSWKVSCKRLIKYVVCDVIIQQLAYEDVDKTVLQYCQIVFVPNFNKQESTAMLAAL